MLLFEKEIEIPRQNSNISLLNYFREQVLYITSPYKFPLRPSEVPIRFAITSSDDKKYHCELGILADFSEEKDIRLKDIFSFTPRKYENHNEFNAVLIVPTGIGSEIGGHAGDAGPVARLLSSACDNLITHPNVVNASDINELPENGLYVEGSFISDLLMGNIGLQKVKSNRVLMVIDKHKERQIREATINAVSAARATLGLDCPGIIEIDPPIEMTATYSTSGRAVGHVEGMERLYKVLKENRDNYDAVALASVIHLPVEYYTSYFQSNGDMVNPWGGVEAIFTHAVTMLFGVPTAHSPMFENMEIANMDVGIVDPRMSAEVISACFLHCILKGMHNSPRIVEDKNMFGQKGIISAADISCIIIPENCLGLPTLAALEQGIPVIAVKENHNEMKNDLNELPFASGKYFKAENYLEAVGIMECLKSGVSVPSVRRPLFYSKISQRNF